MDFRCTRCGSSNPAANRYCGQCGSRLEQLAADPLKEVPLESRTTPSKAAENSAFLPPYIIIDHEAGTNDEAQQVSETFQMPGQLRIVYENPNTSVSAPPNPGSSDGSAPEYYDVQGDRHPHLWRNITLCVLGVAVIVAAAQWRPIRYYGLRQFGWASAQDHSLNAEERRIEEAPNPPAVASPNANHGLSAKPTGDPPRAANPSAAPRTLASAAAPYAMGAPLREPPENQQPGIVGRRFNSSPSGNLRPERTTQGTAPGSDEINRAAKSSSAEGSGVVQSCDQAQILLRVAAAKGNKEAMVLLQQNRFQTGCAPR